jgi:Ethanolamine utilization protein EutJ (predicted chaperonin)
MTTRKPRLANHDIKKGEEYAILTNRIHQACRAWANETAADRKKFMLHVDAGAHQNVSLIVPRQPKPEAWKLAKFNRR